MGCFLGCFGFPSKRKRRQPSNKYLLADQGLLISYEPLDSSVSTNLDHVSSNSELSIKPKERSSIKIRKKVSFNLNVQTYEPIPDEETNSYQLLESAEEGGRENHGEEAENGKIPLVSDGNSDSLPKVSYRSNHRYHNCIDSYDEEDEIAYEESDLDMDDYEEEDEDENSYDNEEESDLEQFDPLPKETFKEAPLLNLEEDEAKPNNKSQLSISRDGNLKPLGSGNAKIRSQYVSSVLNPVENISQWKAVKARAAPVVKHLRKENIAVEQETEIPLCLSLGSHYSPSNSLPNCYQSKPLLQDIAVDASLSNWLSSPNAPNTKTTVQRCC